jgi:transcription elongation factor Elf1
VKYIKIPSDFFNREQVDRIGDNVTLLLYIHLLCEANKNGKGEIAFGGATLTEYMMQSVFNYPSLSKRCFDLEQLGLIEILPKSIKVYKALGDKHDRSSTRYREWRTSVFLRDNFTCVKCGSKKNIQAHHIEPWKKNKKLRYEVSNGTTLCRECHLEAHGGCWRNG